MSGIARWFTIALIGLATSVVFGQEKISLFNGKDLSGWEGREGFWSVQDGAITGTTTAENPLKKNTFLVWTGGEVDEFKLTLKYRLVGGNSGIQYRSKLLDPKEFVVGGYQADIEAGDRFSGILYEERGRGILARRGQEVAIGADGKMHAKQVADGAKLQDVIKKEDWNEYTIIARGNHLIHKINGRVMSETIDNQADKAAKSGILALQIHVGPPMVVQFKDIVLTKLSDENSSADQAAANQGGGGDVPQWIWSSNNAASGEVAYFRKTIDVDLPRNHPHAARLQVSGDNHATVYVNGKKVGHSDDWQNPIDVDVKKHLRKGSNVIAIEAKNDEGIAAVIAALQVFPTRNDKPITFSTDASWQASSKATGDWQAASADTKDWGSAVALKPHGEGPWGALLGGGVPGGSRAQATDPASFSVADGFKVDLLYSVPKPDEGSWINMCVDPKGRLIVSDQMGILYRIDPDAEQIDPEPIRVKPEGQDGYIGSAHGLCFAFGSLYAVVSGGKVQDGLYRIRDTDGDDQFDSATLLRRLVGRGEHGPHAVVPTPDGKGLYVVSGNHTDLTEIASSRVPQVWDEDQLLPRMWDATGHATGRMAPGGWIARVDPEGKHWELISMGYRNQFDIALNPEGEMFTYDSDMEWDVGSPWYRPTRVNHVTSGSEFGWRSGTGKWPAYYPDSLPAIADVGPGSPTGLTFGYGAKLPAKYQKALFINDWSYGNIYAVHLSPNGSSYDGEVEKFITGRPLPVTDIVVRPQDRAIYFVTGGRGTQSGLYRVTYSGAESTAPVATTSSQGAEARKLRRELEQYHGKQHPEAVNTAWPHLASQDRFLRFAARTAIEHQPVGQWAERALRESQPQAAIEALLALTRHGDASLQPRVIASLDRIEWEPLSEAQKLALLRVYGLAFIRMGKPDSETANRLGSRLLAELPTDSPHLNMELARILAYLETPGAIAKILELQEKSPSQEEQIHYALCLRPVSSGWTPELRKRYFAWFNRAAAYKGGHSFNKFLHNIKAEALKQVPEAEKAALAKVLEQKPEAQPPTPVKPRQFVKNHTVEALLPLARQKMANRDFESGREAFAAAMCISCHRIGGVGGAVGPDLTGVGNRFDVRELLESIIEPSKVISDQYQSVIFKLKNGKTVMGRIVNLSGANMAVNVNMLDPGAKINVKTDDVVSQTPSPVSMMPPGLINTLTEDEVLDLLAYLISGGNANDKLFK